MDKSASVGSLVAGRGSAQVAICAQRLLEHSLLTELQGVVARTLQGVDMFSQKQLAGILGHSHPSSHLPAQPSDAHSQVGHASLACAAGRSLPLAIIVA